jgi:hypothetical protein
MAACRSMSHDDHTGLALPEPRFESLAAARDAGVVTPFRAWRGRSGRRYVVSVYRPEALQAQDGAVLIAVRREAGGRRRIVAVGIDGVQPSSGADEIHVHLLAGTDIARAAVAADLLDG